MLVRGLSKHQWLMNDEGSFGSSEAQNIVCVSQTDWAYVQANKGFAWTSKLHQNNVLCATHVFIVVFEDRSLLPLRDLRTNFESINHV